MPHRMASTNNELEQNSLACSAEKGLARQKGSYLGGATILLSSHSSHLNDALVVCEYALCSATSTPPEHEFSPFNPFLFQFEVRIGLLYKFSSNYFVEVDDGDSKQQFLEK